MRQTRQSVGAYGAAGFSVLLLYALFGRSAVALQGVKDGLQLFAEHVLPSLLPFFVCTQLLFFSGVPQRLKLLYRPLLLPYRLGDACGAVVPLCLLAGAPTGAKLLAELYAQGKASRGEVLRVAACATVTGPAFLIATTGALLGSPQAGVFVYAVQVLAALLNGLLWRGMGDPPLAVSHTAAVQADASPFVLFVRAIQDACTALLPVGGAICLFSLLQALLAGSGVDAGIAKVLRSFLPESLAAPLLGGALEVSMGVASLCKAAVPSYLRLCAMAAVASFGGLSILAQVFTFIKDAMPLGIYLMQRLSHAFLAFALARLSLLVFPLYVPAVAPLPAMQTETLLLQAPLLLPIACILALLVWPLVTSSRH